MKIKVKDNIYELSTMCSFDVKDNKLYNCNSCMFEAVDGDTVQLYGKEYKVNGYSIYQMIPTVDDGNLILTYKERKNLIINHNTKVFEVDD